jgi:hypothetical protein
MFWGFTIAGALTGALAIVEWLLPNTVFINFISGLGYQDYFRDYVNQTSLYGEGLTSSSMWLSLGGDSFLRRAGSIYLVSKPYAFTYLLIIPTTLAFLWVKPNYQSSTWVRIALALSWIGLILSFTRAAIIVCLLVSIGMALYVGRSKTAFRISAILFATGLVVLTLSPVQNYINRILQAEDSSTQQHLDGWINGLSASPDKFFVGYGIGTANQETLRFDLSDNVNLAGSISESLYVQTFQELGAIGLLLYLAIIMAILARSRKLARSADLDQKFLGISLVWVNIACMLISVAAILSQGSFLVTYFFWFLCGQANSKALSSFSYSPNKQGPVYAHNN